MKNLIVSLVAFFLLIQSVTFIGNIVRTQIETEQERIENAQTSEIEAL